MSLTSKRGLANDVTHFPSMVREKKLAFFKIAPTPHRRVVTNAKTRLGRRIRKMHFWPPLNRHLITVNWCVLDVRRNQLQGNVQTRECWLKMNYQVREHNKNGNLKKWKFPKFEFSTALERIWTFPKTASLRRIFSRAGSFCTKMLSTWTTSLQFCSLRFSKKVKMLNR